MTRTGPTFRRGNGGNIARAQFCNKRHAALMVRIHADGSPDRSIHGVLTLVPAYHIGWTDDIYRRSLRAGTLLEKGVVLATGARGLGILQRQDLTGFNWSNVPAALVETGFMTNPTERRRLQSSGYQWSVARGIAAGTIAFVGKP
jgi:N-acetylmuramoyl-L-alanine amidase